MRAVEELAVHLKPARQGRSRATLERVMAAFARLLATKPFDQITMAELAAEARASLPSIYARFGDKKALLLAAHEDFKAAIETELDGYAAEPPPARADVERVLADRADRLCDVYAQNHNLLRGVLLADSPILYRRASELAGRCAAEVARLAGLAGPQRDPDVVAVATWRAVAAAIALLQQQLIFGDGELPDELRDHVHALVLGALDEVRAR